LARLELAKRLRSAPTPAKAMEKEVGSRWGHEKLRMNNDL
jgi:hypothetical protein